MEGVEREAFEISGGKGRWTATTGKTPDLVVVNYPGTPGAKKHLLATKALRTSKICYSTAASSSLIQASSIFLLHGSFAVELHATADNIADAIAHNSAHVT